MVTALDVSNNIIRRALADKKPLSPMKLQKLVYFTYAKFYAEAGGRLFSERFGTWKYGPVVDTIYQEFKSFGSNSINRHCIQNNVITSVDEDSSDLFKRIISDIWCRYGDYNGIELSKITHAPGSAWKIAFDSQQPFLDDNNICNDGRNLIG